MFDLTGGGRSQHRARHLSQRVVRVFLSWLAHDHVSLKRHQPSTRIHAFRFAVLQVATWRLYGPSFMPHAGAIWPDRPQELIDHRTSDGMSVDQGEAPLQQAVDIVGIIDEVADPLNAVDIVGLVAEVQNRDAPDFAGINNVAGTPLAKANAHNMRLQKQLRSTSVEVAPHVQASGLACVVDCPCLQCASQLFVLSVWP